jgi:hypothetical protein
MARALRLLRSKQKDDGTWQLEKSQNIIGSIGQVGCANAFLTERANKVLALYGY